MISDVIFHGGTCLRIISGTNRYSEDLDFFVKISNSEFQWQKYLNKVGKDCAHEGID